MAPDYRTLAWSHWMRRIRASGAPDVPANAGRHISGSVQRQKRVGEAIVAHAVQLKADMSRIFAADIGTDARLAAIRVAGASRKADKPSSSPVRTMPLGPLRREVHLASK